MTRQKEEQTAFELTHELTIPMFATYRQVYSGVRKNNIKHTPSYKKKNSTHSTSKTDIRTTCINLSLIGTEDDHVCWHKRSHSA